VTRDHLLGRNQPVQPQSLLCHQPGPDVRDHATPEWAHPAGVLRPATARLCTTLRWTETGTLGPAAARHVRRARLHAHTGQALAHNSFSLFDNGAATTTCLETYHLPDEFEYPEPECCSQVPTERIALSGELRDPVRFAASSICLLRRFRRRRLLHLGSGQRARRESQRTYVLRDLTERRAPNILGGCCPFDQLL